MSIINEVTEDDSSRPVNRIAIVSTPRSGNTWLRQLLSTSYSLKECAAHTPANINWEALPRHCVLQIHWHRTEPFFSLLEKYKFRIVTLSRHPLDVLISILHFSSHETETIRWLGGEGGNEVKIRRATPISQEFLEYATGPRSTALLKVSREWWGSAESYKLRYEDLVQNIPSEINKLGEWLGFSLPCSVIATAIAANSIERLRTTSHNEHFWRGQPGHWKKLLPAATAHNIAQAHYASFDELGYVCEPDEHLDNIQALINWDKICKH